MRKLILGVVLMAGYAAAQPALDANSIMVTAVKTVVLTPTEATFMLNVSADFSLTLDQVLAAIDFGLTAQDLMGINSYPIGPYPPQPSFSRITYVFRLTVPFAKMKETSDKLEKVRKSLDGNMDMSYSTSSVGPSEAAVDEAHDKALPDLMADAKKRAQALASAAQLKLGAVQAVSESGTYPAGPYPTPANLTFSVFVRFAAQ